MSRLRTQPRARTEAATPFRACQSHRVLSRKDCTAQECSVPMEVDTKPAADQAESTKCWRCCPGCSGTRGDSSEVAARWASWIREGNKAATRERGLFSIKSAWSSPASWPRAGTMRVPKRCTWRCSINCSACYLYLLQGWRPRTCCAGSSYERGAERTEGAAQRQQHYQLLGSRSTGAEAAFCSSPRVVLRV